MITRSRIAIAVLWALSLVVVAQWSAKAQVASSPGVEIRFVGQGQSGILVGNFGGQWLPVNLATMPHANDLSPSSRP